MDGLNQKTTDREKLQVELGEPGPERIWYVGDAFAQGFTLDEVHNITHIDPWFLSQIKEIVDIELALEQKTLSDLDYATLWELKRRGFSDRRLAFLLDSSESEVRKLRHQLNVRPVYKRVDTCAAEFATRTAYMYSTYEEECEAAPTDRKKIVVLGGPNRIGQGIEFDYCCVHAALALRDDGFETIMVNCNPETVSTDYDTSDRLYFEPLTLEDVLEIVHKENPVGMIVQYGGQTPLKLRARWKPMACPSSAPAPSPSTWPRTASASEAAAQTRSAPAAQPHGPHRERSAGPRRRDRLPAGGAPELRAGRPRDEIVHEQQDLERYMREAVKVSNDSPVLLDRFLNNATEVDVDCLSDGETVFIGGVMEHIEQAGVHSGDSACSLPPYSLSADVIAEIKRQTAMMAKALNVNGLMNVQFAIQGGDVYVLEVNPRASRTVPYVSKATGLQLAKIAARHGRPQAGRPGCHQGSRAALLLGQGSRVPVRQVPGRGHHPGTGNEVDRRSHGRGQQLRRSLRQVAAGRRRAPAGIRHGVHQREESGQAPRRGSGARPARPGLQTGRHARHGRRDRARRRCSW